MLGESHSLLDEFPDYKDRIHTLKHQDDEFASMAREYHNLDHRIRGLEMNDVPTSDTEFNRMKSRRVELKDQLYNRIINGSGR
ncbi:YdcH family protein [Ferrimonas sp. SCSIO 43195]|uniref:YdcH family protein n=1 Tax=Ferrimonas sp. SCSIO 43195 TaxID=2822844 RepID=UPI0020765D14|nr:DUF465 domain-containing protein [Ferrimonas sp. SCSIO 43195]USD36853.1 DUF465 domain-containing protein [Ferrimonas sp. SCSIO 43195]